MAKIRILIDTDIMIDSIKGVRAAKELFRMTPDVNSGHETLSHAATCLA